MNFEIKTTDLLLALNAVKHAAPTRDARYYLNGVRVELEDVHAMFVATDGHRLAAVQTYVSAPVPVVEPFAFTLDADQLPLLCKWLQQFAKTPKATVTVTYERCKEGGEPQPGGGRSVEYALPGSLTFGCVGSVFVARSRPHDEKFPDWRRVMANPSGFKNPQHSGCFNGEYLADVAKVAKLFNQKYGGIRIGLDQGLAFFECKNADGVEFRETLMGMKD